VLKTKPFVYLLGRPPLVCDVLPHLLGQRWAREPLVQFAPCVPAVPFQLTAERRAVPANVADRLALGVQLGYPVVLLSAKMCVVVHYSLTSDVD
jgi:hypothetical protein